VYVCDLSARLAGSMTNFEIMLVFLFLMYVTHTELWMRRCVCPCCV
jgi:hypothetical protein